MPSHDDALVFENPKLSILERPRRAGDDLPDDGRPSARLLRPHTSRLALDHSDTQLYVGEATRDKSIYFAHREPMSGGAWEFPRWALAKHRAAVAGRTGYDGRAAQLWGVITDEVIAVEVVGHQAVMGENVFFVALEDSALPDEVALATESGEHVIRRRPPPWL
jgi:hypothetical protein